MDFIKKTSTLYFIAAILFLIVAVREKSSIWTILGCVNIIFGINYKKRNR
ncbi:MAG: hypothetical protein E6344_19580 [Clostridium sp.]|nr:hypothetical protein [Clostridium sp.]MDU7085891.1 hypothetical protein [Clostridium sp.]